MATATTVGKKTMLDVWNYFKAIIKANNNTYKNGKWGQFANGKQQFDCVCTIKACGWGVPINEDITANQYDYISKNKATIPDVSISYFYDKATRKGTDMAKIPTDILTFVYKDNSHIGIYNPSTKTVCETCAGTTMGTIERKMSDYPTGYWNKWSNGYYFTDSTVKTSASTPVKYTYQGFLDTVTESSIGGWCWNGVNDTACKVTIKIYKGSILKKTLTANANIFRYDLKSAGKGNGYHGFSIKVDLSGLESGTYTVKAYAPDGTQLTNTKTISIKKTLTVKSYPDYTKPNEFYRVRKSFNDSASSKGSFSIWANAYDTWNKNKSAGYHVYDKDGKQLD